jgi:hypothetical protein
MTARDVEKMGFALPPPGSRDNRAVKVRPSSMDTKSTIEPKRAQISLAPLTVSEDGTEATAGPVPNKTEQKFYEHFRRQWDVKLAKHAPARLRLASGIFYTPDWLFLTAGGLWFFEVKGPHIHSRDSVPRFKAARVEYPFWNFGFAQWKGGEWRLSGNYPDKKTA